MPPTLAVCGFRHLIVCCASRRIHALQTCVKDDETNLERMVLLLLLMLL